VSPRLERSAAPISLADFADDVLLTPAVVAKILGVSARQVGRLGELPIVEVSPRVHRVRASDLRAWIAARVRNGRAA
jgi:hypothetical protein